MRDFDWIIYIHHDRLEAWNRRRQLHRLGYVTRLLTYAGGVFEVRARI